MRAILKVMKTGGALWESDQMYLDGDGLNTRSKEARHSRVVLL